MIVATIRGLSVGRRSARQRRRLSGVMREMYSVGVERPFGTWPSPISAEAVATQGLRMGGVAVDGDDVYWLEGRPKDGGRNVLMRVRADGRRSEVTPPGFNVRTRVQEYRWRSLRARQNRTGVFFELRRSETLWRRGHGTRKAGGAVCDHHGRRLALR